METAILSYDYLVVAPGIQINWDQIKGLKESIGKDGVCSNYSIDTVASTWKFISELKQGAIANAAMGKSKFLDSKF